MCMYMYAKNTSLVMSMKSNCNVIYTLYICFFMLLFALFSSLRKAYNFCKLYYHYRLFTLHRRSPSLHRSLLMPGAYSSPPCKLPLAWPRRWRERRREIVATRKKREGTLPHHMMETFISLPSSLNRRCVAMCMYNHIVELK